VLGKDGEHQWDDRARYAEVLHRGKDNRNILHAVKKKRRKAKWIGRILRRNVLLKYIAGKTGEGIDVT
jgi:hypothetical protein